jgi:hypothetical protein
MLQNEITRTEQAFVLAECSIVHWLTCSALTSLKSQFQNIKPEVSIRAWNAGEISELLISRDQDFNFNHPVEIPKQSAVEETEEP